MQHDFTLTPNASTTIDVVGRFFKYKSGNGLIRVRATRGGYIDLMPGQGVENESFTGLTIQDRSGLNNSGVILAGDFNFRDERISGTVDVIDGGKSRVLSGVSFMTSRRIAAAATAYATTQLWNPAGSGKNLYLNQINVATDVAGSVLCYPSSAELTVTLALKVANKRQATGAAGESSGWWTNAGSVPTVAEGGVVYASTAVTRKIFEFPLAANVPFNYKLTEPLLIPPGFGVSCQALTIGTAGIWSSFEITEEII